MCRKETTRGWPALWAVSLSVGVLAAQTAPSDWRRVGNTSVELGLASPGTGPVESVWYAADGSRLYARTKSGRTFETTDFENWSPAATPSDPADPPAPSVDRVPERGVKLEAAASGRIYALGGQLYRSDDGGRSWTNLTGYRAQSVIGSAQRSVAVSPADRDQVVVANDYGVWRSMDGGLSWSGLNQELPNLPATRILATPANGRGVRIEAGALGSLELPPGSADAWQPVADVQAAVEARALSVASRALGTPITAVASSGSTAYAGSADGRIWVSLDFGRTWTPSPRPGTNGPVERIVADPTEPRVALAAVGGSGPHILRTTNSGEFWDDLTSNLPDVPAHSVAAVRAAGAVYAATDKGVFYAKADLENAGPAAVTWLPLNSHLPAAPATDVRLDANGYQLYAAMDGYGVYATPAPHRLATLHLLNAADYSTRPAAPGSLVSVVGGRVRSASVGNLTFPVLAASDAESQIQVPFDAEPANLSLALQTGAGRFTLGLPVQPVSPAIFVNRDGSPMILDGDSGLMLDGRNVAHSHGRIQILATGFGKVHPDWPAGVPAPLDHPPVVAASVKAYLDRQPVQVTRATLASGYVGFYLIEIQLPEIVNDGPAELYLTADGQESNRVQLVLEQ